MSWIGFLLLVPAAGCAATPYRYGAFRHPADQPAPENIVIEHGAPNSRLDRIAWWIGAPARLFPWNKNTNTHQVSDETLAQLTEYLERNDLKDVYVYINHYDPASQWRRLKENKRIAAVWRYSFGVVHFLGYTLLPNRIFGGDDYDPYTNSLYLNSDAPVVAIQQAALAKEVHSRKLPGLCAIVNDLPVLSLLPYSHSVSDVLGYARDRNDWILEKQAYHTLYGRIGAESLAAASPLLSVWWGGIALGVGGGAVGHVTGRMIADRREHQLQDTDQLVAKGEPSAVPDRADDVRQASYFEPSSNRPQHRSSGQVTTAAPAVIVP